jgi:DNA-binding NarL/FixJ family response regulator
MRCVVLSVDLMDRSRFPAGTTFVRDGADLDGEADVVAVDLSRPDALAAIERLRAAGTGARVVAYGSHVDRALLDAAREAGADAVLARSAFFADVVAALEPPT